MARIHKNKIFRWHTCGLSIEKTAKICSRSVSTVTKWDAGRPIPPECKLLMQIMSGINLEPISKEWKGWHIRGNLLIAPGGESMSVERLWEIASIQADARAKRPNRDYGWYWEMLKRKG